MDTLRRAAVTAAIYLVAARYSIALSDLTGLGAVFWPGAGVTLTALLVAPRRSWLAILLAVAVAEVGNGLLIGSGLPAALWWAAANVTGPLVATHLIQRWHAERFTDALSVVRLVVAAALAAGVAGLIGAIGTGTLTTDFTYLAIASQWLVGDALGMVTVLPAGLVLTGWIPRDRLGSTEALGVLTAVAAVTTLVFSLDGTAAFGYLIVVPMVWAAVRLHVAGAAIAVLLAAQLANLLNALGRGPFVTAEPTMVAGSVQLQLFLVTVSITVLLLGVLTVESARFSDLAAERGRLIAAVSHELRTPLTPIIGFTELLLRRDDLDDRARDALRVVHRNGRHLTLLVEDLLQASRAHHGRLPVEPEVVRLDVVLADLVAEREGHDLRIGTSPPDAQVVVDRTHLVQILANLLDNAVRHGRPPVTLDVTEREGWACIAVRDEGDGVPAWFVDDLFEDFAQATAGDRRPSMGLGLGLPIARTLAQANGGELTYRPQEHGGCFELTLPRTARTGPQQSTAPSPPHTESPGTLVPGDAHRGGDRM